MLKILNSESLRLHMDWWGKCRTCDFWKGQRKTMEDGMCDQPQGDFGGEITTSEGHCGNWETYDSEVALEILQAEEEAADGDRARMEMLQGRAHEIPVLSCRFCGNVNVHTLERCAGCERKHWNAPDDTRLGRDMGALAREDSDVARAQGRYETNIRKIVDQFGKKDDG